MTEDNRSYDLVVIGGGLAGLTAGVRASELGLRVVLLEKGTGEVYPCNSRQSGGVMHIGFLDPYRLEHELMEVVAQRTANSGDMALASALARTGGRLLDWLQDKGARFVRFNEQEGNRWCLAPPRALRAGLDWQGRGPDQLLRHLVSRLTALGGDFRAGSRVSSLIMDSGVCRGVRVQQDGHGMDVRALNVLIADGGFQSDPELYERHIGGSFDRVFQRGARSGVGDGLRMAIDAGARLSGTERFYGHILCADAYHSDAVWPYPELDAIATSGIVVNGTGVRVADEGVSGVHLTNELAKVPTDEQLFVVIDSLIWQTAGTSARIPANPLLEESGGTVHRADTVKELAIRLGVPPDALMASVAAHNTALVDGTLEFLKPTRSTLVAAMAIEQAPFIAIPVCPSITYTMGGIAIDDHAQVLDPENRPIPGLMAAGACTGGLEGGSRSAYIGGLMKAGVFGMLAAERAAELRTKEPIVGGTMTPWALSADPPADAPASRPHRLARFPVLRGVLAVGQPTVVFLAVALGFLSLWLMWPILGVIAVPFAVMVAGVLGILGLSYVELIRMITETLMPD